MALFWPDPQYGPIDALLKLQHELEQALSNPFDLDLGLSGHGVFPLVNVFSNRDGYVVRVEIPGIAPEHLNIETQDRTLVISGKRKSPAPDGGSFHRRERSSLRRRVTRRVVRPTPPHRAISKGIIASSSCGRHYLTLTS